MARQGNRPIAGEGQLMHQIWSIPSSNAVDASCVDLKIDVQGCQNDNTVMGSTRDHRISIAPEEATRLVDDLIETACRRESAGRRASLAKGLVTNVFSTMSNPSRCRPSQVPKEHRIEARRAPAFGGKQELVALGSHRLSGRDDTHPVPSRECWHWRDQAPPFAADDRYAFPACGS